MRRKSIHTITYKDLIVFMTKQEVFAKARESGARSRGVTNMDPLVHDVECAKKLKEMLEKCEPGKQADLFELFEKTTR